jgi:hypothetical protein
LPAQVERRNCCRGQREPTGVTQIDYRFDLLATPMNAPDRQTDLRFAPLDDPNNRGWPRKRRPPKRCR